MSSAETISILGLTAEAFVERTAPILSADRALEVYRSVFRDGRIPDTSPMAVHLPSMPIAQSQQELGTLKFTQSLDDAGYETESVVIPGVGSGGRERRTLCVSSQVGCAMGCVFCETAQMGLRRQLTTEEIIAQWFTARHRLGQAIDNIVFMGMGEPMDNIDAVLSAIHVLTDDNGPGIAPSRITVSTVGRTEGIRRYAELACSPGYRKLRLAVSVNAPNDAIRSSIMPLNRAEPMESLRAAMLTWPSRVLIEYVLIPGVNDAVEHAAELCAYVEPLDCTVNVIPYNPRRDSPWPAPEESTVDAFVEAVASHGQSVRRRGTHGRSVMAACGQLGTAEIRRRRRPEFRVSAGRVDS